MVPYLYPFDTYMVPLVVATSMLCLGTHLSPLQIQLGGNFNKFENDSIDWKEVSQCNFKVITISTPILSSFDMYNEVVFS